MAEAPDAAAVILYHFTTIGNLGMIRALGQIPTAWLMAIQHRHGTEYCEDQGPPRAE
jgi:hypothetical protein